MPALETPPAIAGWHAPDFKLEGIDGKMYTLQEAKGPKGLLVMFICNHCPFVQAIASKLSRDTKDLARIGVKSIGIMSNDFLTHPEDSFDNMKKFANEHGFTFPYVIDRSQKIARDYGAVCTPDFFGFDGSMTLQYRGRLDDSGMEKKADAKRELYEAMKQIATTGRAPAKQSPSIGCSIKWRA